MKDKIRYFFNTSRKKKSEQIFQGISDGRKKALESWFTDQWISMDTIKNLLQSQGVEHMQQVVTVANDKFETLIEIFITDAKGSIVVSSYQKHIGRSISAYPNVAKAAAGESYLYGPYCDEMTLDLDLGSLNRRFYDEVTLLFSHPLPMGDQSFILFARVLNDDMSNVIQEEDTHIYKDSGDNYLFMVENKRGLAPGTAISRSRFEDDTFTLGENLKQGIKTKKWGEVKVKKHTELEIIFTDPKSGELHEGVQRTIRNGENLNCWPGYPDYRHIMVGGKGVTITPPHSDEVWGMMCEGDISDIYHYSSLNRRIPVYTGILAVTSSLIGWLLQTYVGLPSIAVDVIIWAYLMVGIYLTCSKAITHPLNHVTEVMQDMAEGEGDLRKRVSLKSTNEIGQLVRWFNKFISNQMNMIKRVGAALKTSDQTVRTVSDSSRLIQKSIDDIEQAVEVLSEHSKRQDELFDHTQEQVRKIADSFDKNQEVNEMIDHIREKTQNTKIFAHQSEEVREETQKANDELSESMKQAVSGINKLGDTSRKITDIVSTINNISSQTNLLALNASIEAARAGDVGKGFAVVANEIKDLSEETGNATKGIEQLISSIQQEIMQTNTNIRQIEQKVGKSLEFSEQSMQAVSMVMDISDTLSQVVNMMDGQTRVIAEAGTNIEQMQSQSAQYKQISQSSVEDALRLTQSVSEQNERLSKVVEALQYSTRGLEDIVASFQVG